MRIPCVKSCRKFLAKTKEWLKRHMHWKRRDQQRQLTSMLHGFYQYFGLHHCKPKLDSVRRSVTRQWSLTLRRRSQRHRMYWSYLKSRLLAAVEIRKNLTGDFGGTGRLKG